jgi:hypothetical protein
MLVTIPYLLFGQLTMAPKALERKTRPAAARKALRAAASGPVLATVKGRYSGPLMNPWECGICPYRPDRVMSNYGHQVESEPAETALDMAPRLPVSTNRSGWSVRLAGATMPIWWYPALSGALKKAPAILPPLTAERN